jgi:hypothetical protein
MADDTYRQVWLGLAGDMVGPEDLPDQYATRVGGHPVYPGNVLPSTSATYTCGVCQHMLSLIMQVWFNRQW